MEESGDMGTWNLGTHICVPRFLHVPRFLQLVSCAVEQNPIVLPEIMPKTKSVLLSPIRLVVLPVKLKKTFECHFSITVAKNVSDDCGPVK